MIILSLNPFRGGVDHNLFSIAIKLDEVCINSPPQSVAASCADLIANRRFLRNGSAKVFFAGDEPLFRMNVEDRQVVLWEAFSRGPSDKPAKGSFNLLQADTQIDKVLSDSVEGGLISRSDLLSLEAQVDSDDSLGVFDYYIKD